MQIGERGRFCVVHVSLLSVFVGLPWAPLLNLHLVEVPKGSQYAFPHVLVAVQQAVLGLLLDAFPTALR